MSKHVGREADRIVAIDFGNADANVGRVAGVAEVFFLWRCLGIVGVVEAFAILAVDRLGDQRGRLKIGVIAIEDQREVAVFGEERREDVGLHLAAAVHDADHRLLRVVDGDLSLAEGVDALVVRVRTLQRSERQPAAVEALAVERADVASRACRRGERRWRESSP